MPEIRYSSSSKAGFTEPLARVYLLIGGEDALKREAAARLVEAGIDPSFADFDRETLDFGAGGSAGENGEDPAVKILAAASSAPFGSPRKVVIATSIQRLSKDRQEAVAAGLAKLGELTLLILVADAPEYEAGRPKGKQVEAALKKAAAASGVVVACEPLQAGDLKARARQMIAETGKTAEEGVLSALVARASSGAGSAGGDLQLLVQETQKLITFVGDRRAITGDDIHQVIAGSSDETIFPLLDAIGARNTKRALELADSLLDCGEKADAVVARSLVMLQRHFRLLSLAKYLADSRIAVREGLPAEAKELLSGELVGVTTGQAYRLPAYLRQAAGFTWQELRRGMESILASDLAMKGIRPAGSLSHGAPAAEDPAANLRILVLTLCRRDLGMS